MYKCECGQEFNSSQACNSHKGHCKIHLLAVGKYEKFLQSHKIAGKKSSQARIKNNKIRKAEAEAA